MRIAAIMTQSPPLDQPAAGAPPGQADEHVLLASLRNGNRGAAEELVRHTYRRIWALLFRLTGGEEEVAADLTQETYRKAWAALPSFDGRSAFSTWAFRIAYTTWLNHRRRPRPVVPMEDGLAARVRSEDPDAEALTERAQQDERLMRAVLGLPDPHRRLVAARFWGEVPVRELSAAEGISEQALRKRLRKALAILRDTLEVKS
ncbi:MAG: sigma-70 family RNA polymerase sigma factor [Acidobacteria bacterium]|jgi:RNA polymerase sigma-70 factor, ECF subfamily|nr:sigma-70 family RNA polymerase sigma factor [Acidobacteriota bacterium]